jgi:DNA (cytosine-5)-methyltransferase 1
MLTTLDLFAGIGGFALGLEATGFFRTTCFVENEPYCQAVLRHHWPRVPVLGDIKNVQRSDLPDLSPDVIVGGFPCQPFSHAGKQRAQDDPRHLWPEMFRLIRECRPTWVIGENVAGIIKLGLDEVLSDLESEGYATRTFNIPACAVGAPHIRQRLWIIAHSDSHGEPDGAFDGDTRQGQLGFGRSETSSHGSDADESGSHRAAEHEHDPKHGQTQLRDKQVGELGQMGKVVADADSDDRRRERCTKSQEGTTRVEHGGSGSRQLERGIDADVADASSGRQRRSGKGQMEQSRRAETKRTSETLANTDETGCEQQRRSKSAQEEQPSIEHGGSLSDAASGGRPEVWWKVEPPVGRVVDGLPNRVPQLRALGNSIIPQIAQEIGNAIKALENDKEV